MLRISAAVPAMTAQAVNNDEKSFARTDPSIPTTLWQSMNVLSQHHVIG